MTVESTTRKQQFTLNGTISTLTFTFRALVSAPTDIKVKVTDGDGVDTDLIYTTDYTVAVNANGVGGVVTLVDAEATGSGTATVFRETTNKQESDYDDYNQFPADTLETDFDIRTLVSQEGAEASDRILQLPISYSGTASTILPTPVANKVLGWNGAASALENKTFVPSSDFEKATLADAQAGTNDTKYVTPLRVGSTPSITTLALTQGTLAPKASPVFTGEATIPTVNLTSGNLKFPALQNASGDANTLDDYEEGVWTPILGGGGGTSGQSYGANTGGIYTKIGNRVYCTAYIDLTTKGTITGLLQLQGLPFTSADLRANQAPITLAFADGFSLTADHQLTSHVAKNDTVGFFYETQFVNDTPVALDTNDINDGAILEVSFNYTI